MKRIYPLCVIAALTSACSSLPQQGVDPGAPVIQTEKTAPAEQHTLAAIKQAKQDEIKAAEELKQQLAANISMMSIAASTAPAAIHLLPAMAYDKDTQQTSQISIFSRLTQEIPLGAKGGSEEKQVLAIMAAFAQKLADQYGYAQLVVEVPGPYANRVHMVTNRTKLSTGKGTVTIITRANYKLARGFERISIIAPEEQQGVQTERLTHVGWCESSQVAELGHRLDTPSSGTRISFDNGINLISYGRIAKAEASRANDPVRICLVAVPKHEYCKLDDHRGRQYSVTNLRTRKKFTMQNSGHGCGGA